MIALIFFATLSPSHAQMPSPATPQIHLRCKVESRLTQFVAADRAEHAGFFQDTIDQGTELEYVQQIASSDLAMVTARPRWFTLHADPLTDIAQKFTVPALSIISQGFGPALIRIDVTAGFVSHATGADVVQTRTMSAIRPIGQLHLRADVRKNIVRDTSGLLPKLEGTRGRVVTDNEAWLDLSCKPY